MHNLFNSVQWTGSKAKAVVGMSAILALCLCAHGEMRTWTTKSGETLEGEYVSKVFDSVNIEDASGKLVKIPIDTLSDADKTYLEFINPPTLDIDFLDSAHQVFIKPSPLWGDNSPITVIDYTFGARIKQTSVGEYNHKLVIEGYELSQQVWDLRKYKLIHKFKSAPFVLTKKARRYEYDSPSNVRLFKIIIDQGTGAALPRGQRFAESLILIRDERGQIIAHRTTAKWMYKYLDRLEQLPQGAWLTDECIRTHPSSPPAVPLGYMRQYGY